MNKKLIKIIFTLYFIVQFDNSIYASTLDEELKKLKEAGIPTTFEELNLPEIPDEENGALVYKKAFDLLEILWEKYREEWEYIPYVGIEEWEKLSKEKKKKISDLILNNPDFTEFYKLLEKASQMRCLFFKKEDYNKSELRLSLLICLRGCARLLNAKAKIQKENGEINNALITLLMGLRIGKSLSYELLSISQMTRIAIDVIILNQLRRFLEKEKGDVNIYYSFIEEIRKEREEVLAYLGLKGELIFGMQIFDYLNKRCEEVKKEEITEDERKKVFEELKKFYPDATEKYLQSIIENPKFFLKQQQIFYLTTMAKIIPLSKKSFRESIKELEEIKEGLKKTPETAIFMMYLPVFSRFLLQEAKLDALLGAAEIGIANKIYKQKYGKYVDNLNQLITEGILYTLPLDPFTDKDYIYKKKDKGFIVYSVGEDLKDDGGVEEKFGLKPDIVWNCEE